MGTGKRPHRPRHGHGAKESVAARHGHGMVRRVDVVVVVEPDRERSTFDDVNATCDLKFRSHIVILVPL